MLELELTWTRATNTIMFTLDGVFAGRARWQNNRIVEVMIHDVIASTESLMRLAIDEIELAFLRGIKDPALLEASAPVELLPPARHNPWRTPPLKAVTFPKLVKPKTEGDLRGETNEALGLEVVRTAALGLEWVTIVRKASAEEDSAGVDIVIETIDVGDLFAQVKSSLGGARSWRASHKDHAIYPRTVVLIFEPDHLSVEPKNVRVSLEHLHEEALLEPRTIEPFRAKPGVLIPQVKAPVLTLAPTPSAPPAPCPVKQHAPKKQIQITAGVTGTMAAPTWLSPKDFEAACSLPANGLLGTMIRTHATANVVHVKAMLDVQLTALERERQKLKLGEVWDDRSAWRESTWDLLIFLWPRREEPAVAALIAGIQVRTGVVIDEARMARVVARRTHSALTDDTPMVISPR